MPGIFNSNSNGEIIFQIRGIPVMKSGTDFRDFSVITVTWPTEGEIQKPRFGIERISVTTDYIEDPELKKTLDEYSSKKIYK